MEDDYSTELGKDGSLMLVSAEMKHAGTYTFTVTNRVHSVEGYTKLVVHWFINSVPSQSQSPIVGMHSSYAVLESLTCRHSDSSLGTLRCQELKLKGQSKYTHVLCPQSAYLRIF